MLTKNQHGQTEKNVFRSTAFGVLAMLIWATSVAVSRSLSEQIGVFSAAGYSYFLGGTIGMILVITKRSMRTRLRAVPIKYYMSCGLLMLIYNIAIYLAVGLSSNRQQVLGVTLLNYLWPSFILIFTVTILQRRTRPLLFLLGIAFVLAGAYMATTHNRSISWMSFFDEIIAAPVPYMYAFIAAVSWGLYTVLNKQWFECMSFSDGYLLVPLIFFLSGALLLIISGYSEITPAWSFRVFLEIIYQAVFVWLIAYVLWAIAAQHGSIVWLGILSLFMPLLSTLFTCLYLMVAPGIVLWLACVSIIFGAWICERAVFDHQQQAM